MSSRRGANLGGADMFGTDLRSVIRETPVMIVARRELERLDWA
jgi:hypothetical protein